MLLDKLETRVFCHTISPTATLKLSEISTDSLHNGPRSEIRLKITELQHECYSIYYCPLQSLYHLEILQSENAAQGVTWNKIALFHYDVLMCTTCFS